MKAQQGAPKSAEPTRDALLVELGALRGEVESLRRRNAELRAGAAASKSRSLVTTGGAVVASVIVTFLVARGSTSPETSDGARTPPVPAATVADPPPPSQPAPQPLAAPEPAPPAEPPARTDGPPPDDVANAIRGVYPGAAACAPGEHPPINVSVVFLPSGAADQVTVSGEMPEPVRRCILDAVRGARVSAFKGSPWPANFAL